jgi:hypothetical protein
MFTTTLNSLSELGTHFNLPSRADVPAQKLYKGRGFERVEKLFEIGGHFEEFYTHSWSELSLQDFRIMDSSSIIFNTRVVEEHFKDHCIQYPEFKKSFEYENYAKAMIDVMVKSLPDGCILIPGRPEKSEPRLLLYDLNKNDLIVLGRNSLSNKWAFTSLHKKNLERKEDNTIDYLGKYICFHKFLLECGLYTNDGFVMGLLAEKIKIAQSRLDKLCYVNGIKYSPLAASNIIALRKIKVSQV